MTSENKKKRVTIKEIAHQANLSVATVGRVFASPEQVKPDTLERVMGVAKELGYQPNLAGKALRTGKSYEIAIMLPFDRLGAASTMGAAQYNLIAGFSSNLHSCGYNMKLLPYTSRKEMKDVFESYLAKFRPDAFVLTQLEPKDFRISKLANKQIPMVTFGQSDLKIPTHQFDFDNYAFTKEAVEHLISQGKKSITYISANDNYMHYINQLAGFEAASNNKLAQGIRLNTIKLDLADEAKVESALNEVVATSDAVITVSVHLTHQLKRAAIAQGKKVGEDITICTSTATLNLLQMLDVPVLCYYQDFSLAGDTLSTLALELANNTMAEPKKVINSYEIIELNS
ncbi:LacI family DNA-binding transcriptional regulator [Vibrio maerlii]|uniref:LacI family DNA-binding transcriptional regulator n=1 Tax=Vibrio maerlii TaxID=2231648 RepID=UPI000E3B8C5C|nr:LacI family DNA-binding transcriptional regulator [Vibrio maerlii]